MNIMPCRLIHLTLCLLGYQKTGIILTEFYENKITPFFAADDIGIYILIPKLAIFLNSSIDQAINIFFYGSALLSWLISCIGFFYYYQNFMQRIISIVGISLLMLIALKIGDTYLFYVQPTIALVPWALYFYQHSFSKRSLFFYLFAGIFIGVSHYIRTYASLGVIFFIGWLIITKKELWKYKGLRILFLLIGISLSISYFTAIFNTYSNYIKNNNIENPSKDIKNHLIWHAIYAGFGFLSFKNPENIEWSDSYAAKKAQSIDSTAIYNTPEYEEILKYEVIRLIQNYPAFIIMTIFAKIGILLLYLLVFANFGLFTALINPQSWQLECAFWGALGLSSIFSILTVPIPEYSLGFITFATLYGVASLNRYIHKYAN